MLQHLAGRAYVAPGGVNIGVVMAGDDRAIMIDSGLNDSAARKVLRSLRDQGREVAAIITTHGHADHFGGNAFVVKRTGASVYAPVIDEVILRHPMFQPAMLFAGADPPMSMRGNFMLAEASPVDVVYEPGALMVEGVEFEVISLAGHSGNQMGLLVDGVFYCADVVLPARVIDRYKMPYLYAVGDHLVALETASGIDHEYAVPGHGPVLEDIRPLVNENRELVHDVADRIVRIAGEQLPAGEILARLLEELGADPQDPPSYYLLHPTVYAFLSWLEREGRVSHTIAGGRSLWQATR